MQRLPISIITERVQIPGELCLPEPARALVILARPGGEGSDAVHARAAEALQQLGIATLRLDLLAPSEAQFPDNLDHVPLLTRRLIACLDLMQRHEATQNLPVALAGQEAAAAAVIRVAALRDADIQAVACRDALIDLAGLQNLRLLQAPLLVQQRRSAAARITASQRAFEFISGEKKLDIIDDSTTFDPQQAAQPLAAWFHLHLPLVGAETSGV